MKHLVASLLILAIACRLEAANRIENNRYSVNVEAADGTFTIATKPDGKMVLPAGKLSGTAGTTKTISLDDKKFGQGQGIQITYPDGNREVVALYPNLPFVTFRSTFHNAGNEPLVLNHVPTVSAAVDLGKPLSGISTLGTGGLLEPDKNPGSYAFLSMADPQTRSGVVGGWLTHDRGSGVVFSPVKDGTARIQAQIDYGRLRIKPGAEAEGEWFALGYFDDARFGLEAYAEAVGKIYDVKLLPQTSGLCTWYMDRHAAACDEVHLKELTAASAKELKPFGFEYIQIDDDWQDGVKENGPKKNFTIHAPKGPYPGGMKATADMIESFGLVPGIWFMPFAGNYKDPFFKDRQNLFVKNDKGQPYETSWGGTCLDMTLPETQEFVRSIVHRIAHDWGYKFFKMDGFWTGSGTPQMYVNDAYKRDGIGDAVFANPDKTNIEALRDGAKLVREAAGPDVFLLGCCVVQNMRSFGGSFGLLDAMRVGPDTNDGSIGSLHASPVWFLHGRVWWNDPDFVSVRAGHSLERARLNAGWTAISGQLFYISDWLPAYPADRLDIIKRCLPAHGLPARPVDVFESRIARIWHLADTRQSVRRDVVAYYNWDKDRAEISATSERIGLPPAKEYVGFDFWANKFIPPFTGNLTASLPGHSSRIMAIRPVSENPQLLSTSRHVTQGIVDVTRENWDATKSELSATSKVVGNDPYELRIVVPSSEKSWRATGIKVSAEDEAAGVKVDIKQDGPRLRANISSATSREVKWTVAFERGAAVDVLPPPVAGLKAHVEYNTISLSWTDSGAAAYRVTRSDGETVTEPLAMFIDTKFPREKPLAYKVEALAGDGQAAAPVSIEVIPLTVMTAPPAPPLPMVSLDANNTKFVENTAGQARFGLSYTGKPLSIDGKIYANGYGTHANAVAVATIPQGATRFVATVGIDDAARASGEATVLFEVYGDVKEMGEKPVLLGQSPVLNTKELASWNFNVELNTRFKEVRLVVKDGGNGVNSDHADWVNAGFIVPAEPKPEAPVSLNHVPQIHETKEQYDKRTQWFRDAKFGLFIHWGPCSIGQKEIGWGREANRPWDINQHGPRLDDPVYDNYYKGFNPEKFDPAAWARLAKESGMKYLVLVTKHHDGFSMFDTKLSDYSIKHTPYGRDIVKAVADACHKEGIKLGLYYSTRDWYHPDYLVGDNVKYDEWYRGQIEELLTNYGEVDLLWFDHVGGRDWGKWRFDQLFSTMYRLQPRMLVNNRAAKFCGPQTPGDKGPPSPEIAKMVEGDFYTPEGHIGSMDLARYWESCIHVGKGWSYRGEEGFKAPDDCIRMLVSCTTGGGNLLLNFGPRPDGTITDAETSVAKKTGEWLAKYGESIYGTRGGPYKNGPWGGACHKGNKLFLHIYQWPENGIIGFDPLPQKILSARTLDGAPVRFRQGPNECSIEIQKKDQTSPITVVELAIDSPIPEGTIYGHAHVATNNLAEFGRDLTANATISTSSTSEHENPAQRDSLLRGERSASGYAFHTNAEENPWVQIDLGESKVLHAVMIENRPGDRRSEGLMLSISEDGKTWETVWKAPAWQDKWLATLTRFHAGITVPGRQARYLRLETKDVSPRPLLLQRVTILGQ